ncbi:hypothetical protein QZH41_014729 [Actinostola sp. cb2023]|nr:hypothetical protein QZH41_014729 [Actinostola sp. cb2023]
MELPVSSLPTINTLDLSPDTKDPHKTGLNNNSEDVLYTCTLNTPTNDDANTLHEPLNNPSNHSSTRRVPDTHSRGKRLESINEDSECFSSVVRSGSISSMSFTATPFSGFQVPETTIVPVHNRKGRGTKRLTPREAIPVMPPPVAVLCLILNIVIPGSGTIISGFVAFCLSQEEAMYDKMAVLCVNCFVGLAQMTTVVFLMIGWFWSVTWGCAFVGLSGK